MEGWTMGRTTAKSSKTKDLIKLKKVYMVKCQQNSSCCFLLFRTVTSKSFELSLTPPKKQDVTPLWLYRMKDLLMRHNPYFQGFILLASLSSVEVEGKEWGFRALIAMPTTHNEVYYRADVVRLEWLKRRRQPCKIRSERTRPRGRKRRMVSGEREWHRDKREEMFTEKTEQRRMGWWMAVLKGERAKEERRQ